MSKRAGYFLLLATLIGGCSPSDYQRSADLQVSKLVKDRQKQTVGYTPQVEALVETPAKPTHKSYAKIPTSPIPTDSPAMIEMASQGLEYAKLGPRELFPPGTTSPQHQPLSIEDARRPALERLKLGPPTRLATTTTFDLFQSIEYSVQHSREYQSRMEDLYLAALDVTLERHLFAPRPFARTGLEYAGGQRDVGLRSALTVTNAVGVRQQLPYGGEIVAQGLVDFVRALSENSSDGESAQLVLSGSIPLLRGAGMVNLEPLIQTERELVYEVRRFEDFRRAFVVNIASQYFRLLTQQQAIANRRTNYIASAQLTEQSYAMYAAGRPGFTFLSVQRAQSQQFQNENAIILAEDAYQSSLDDFKIALGMPVEQPLDVVQISLDVTPPDLQADVASLALKYRLDLQTSADRIEDARRFVSVTKNGLLPDLDFSARGAIGNRDNTPAADIDSRTLEYSAAVNLDLPIDRVRERNAYRRSLISLERAQRDWKTTHDLVIGQVRDAVRAIRSARATLEIQQRNIDLARRRVDYANELLVLGRANDSRDSVDAQNALLSALDAFEVARASYQIQILQFLRDTGTLRLDPQASELGLAMDRAAAARQQ